MKPLLEAIGQSRVVVFLGEGGVGKTTLAAAVAMALAKGGERVLAVTVDPSNRLKTSLRLSGQPGLEEPVPFRGARGSLHAMVLDAATELPRLMSKLVSDESRRRRITENIFFRKAAAAMAGTHEYAAMERLLELLGSGRYDRIVLDTPPERHALDFLDAPTRLYNLLSSDIFQLFVRASSGLSRVGLRALRWGPFILRGISRFTGEETFLQVMDFLLAFEPLFESFRERAARARALLAGPETAAIMVFRPASSVEAVTSAVSALRGRGIVPRAAVINRAFVWPPPGCEGSKDTGVDAALVKDALAACPFFGLYAPDEIRRVASAVLVLAKAYRDCAERDRIAAAAIVKAVSPVPVFRVPLLAEEVRDLEGLSSLESYVVQLA